MVTGESFQPFEPSAYCWEPFWECITIKNDALFFVYMHSGMVGLWDETLDKEIENIGYVPSILRENKRIEKQEAEMFARESKRDL